MKTFMRVAASAAASSVLTSSTRALALVAALLAAIMPVAAPAQSPRSDSEDRIARSAERLASGSRVRVTARGATIEGRFLKLRHDSLLIQKHIADAEAIALGDVTSMWVSEQRLGRSIGRGAFWGAATGAAVASFFIWTTPDCDYCVNDPRWGIALGGIPGAAAGTAVGTVVGLTRRPWRRLYP